MKKDKKKRVKKSRKIKRHIAYNVLFVYLILLIFNPFNRGDKIESSRDLVDVVEFDNNFNKFVRDSSEYEIEFLKKYNLSRIKISISKPYVLNVCMVKDIKSLKKKIKRLEDRGYNPGYIRQGSFYYIVVGFFSTFEDAFEKKRDFLDEKNVYPRFVGG